jgi:hypothetical protein
MSRKSTKAGVSAEQFAALGLRTGTGHKHAAGKRKQNPEPTAHVDIPNTSVKEESKDDAGRDEPTILPWITHSIKMCVDKNFLFLNYTSEEKVWWCTCCFLHGGLYFGFFHAYVGCPESIHPFWISREPVALRWCKLAAGQRRHYCAFVSSHSPMRLVGRRWDAVDQSCVLCDRRIHNGRASRSASSQQCTCLSYRSRAGIFGKASYHPGLSAPPTAQIRLPATSGFSQSQNRHWKRGDLWMRPSHSV